MKESFNAILVFVGVMAGLASLPVEKAAAKSEPAEVVIERVKEPEADASTIPDLPEFPPLPKEPVAICVKIHGTDQDVEAFIAQHYKRPWTHPGTIDSHLVEHGVAADDLHLLTADQKLKLHAAIHEKALSEKPVSKAAPPPAPRIVQSCPGGVCPNPRYQAPQFAPRRGLFGRRR